ncbi:uncharacterized protein RCC_08877 [Ramularia collo-cygni]|uniref:F-box domain-containing protein n=1 Tax=Ramularia collo-cygni TaxID=112498 RepID=A0A2D3UYL2_9PEZI|nr:uncharacterized protein RCC_08877 [Ramularia collo-cygni]CZT23167.1 uncharacterized protein RCC_08877 [Ramularia collo-cygni]
MAEVNQSSLSKPAMISRSTQTMPTAKRAPVDMFSKLTPELRCRIYSNLEMKRPAHIHMIAFQFADTQRWKYLFEGFVRGRNIPAGYPLPDLRGEEVHLNNGHFALQCYRALCLINKTCFAEVRPLFLGVLRWSIEIQRHRVFWRNKDYGCCFFESDLVLDEFPICRRLMPSCIMDQMRNVQITIKPHEYAYALDHEKSDWIEALTYAIEDSGHRILVKDDKVCVLSSWQAMTNEPDKLRGDEALMRDCVVSYMKSRTEVAAMIMNDEVEYEAAVWNHESSDKIVSAVSPILDDDDEKALRTELDQKKGGWKNQQTRKGDFADYDYVFDSD